jgi:1,4-dihydroxy-2-naphthoate octaprenyltransferase
MSASLFTSWVMAARLRTLPLSLSGIVVGASLGVQATGISQNIFLSPIFWLAIATTLGLQVLSNFANDYGDGVKGTDNDERIGPKRAIQSGLISQQAMKKGIIITAIVTLVLALLLIYTAFGKEDFVLSVVFFALGVSAIIAAIKYTVGNSAYGYKGLGDVFVFIFFGLVSVVGCYFLYTKTLNFIVFLPAITIGCLSTAVLNLNNLRDVNSDKNSGKYTLVVKMGWPKAKRYHQALGGLALLSLLVYTNATYINLWSLLPYVAFVVLAIHFNKVRQTENSMLLDPELKKVALSTFFFALLFAVKLLIFNA